MDVELQILKHLKRDAQPTVSIIDRYFEGYNDIFPEVRSYECFKYLHLGIVSPIKKKPLPEIAKIVSCYSFILIIGKTCCQRSRLQKSQFKCVSA